MNSGIYSLVLRESFLSEQVLLFETEKGLVVITGCAHPGIVNILEAARKRLDKPIHLVLGGFHLFRENHRTISEIVSEKSNLLGWRRCPLSLLRRSCYRTVSKNIPRLLPQNWSRLHPQDWTMISHSVYYLMYLSGCFLNSVKHFSQQKWYVFL